MKQDWIAELLEVSLIELKSGSNRHIDSATLYAYAFGWLSNMVDEDTLAESVKWRREHLVK